MPSSYLLSILLVCLGLLLQSAASSSATCKPTYHSIGIYWPADSGSSSRACTLKYRKDGSSTWMNGYDLYWESRTTIKIGYNHSLEYRGSLVQLTPNTKYNMQLTVDGSNEQVTLSCTTWSESFTIKRTVFSQITSSTTAFAITEGGDETGYVKYSGPATIDVSGTNVTYAVSITAPYVILDGITVKGGTSGGISLSGSAHDVIIQNNDISGWGTILCDGYGRNYDAGIRLQSNNQNLTRITIQRNVIRDPFSTANGWCDPIITEKSRCQGLPSPAPIHENSDCGFHPQGPQGIVQFNGAGNIVIRYNRISAGIETDHYFNDGIGGGDNSSPTGFPGADSDVYGNWMGHSLDDSLEIEGGGMNVRIWGNFINETYTGVATAVTSVGPLYVFRNVQYFSRRSPRPLTFTDLSSGAFFKLGDFGSYGGGRRYYFHNTMLAGPLEGGRPGLADSGGPMTNTWSRNNIFWVTKIYYDGSKPCCTSDDLSTQGNNIDYDMCSNNPPQSAYTAHSIMNAIPSFKYGNTYCSNVDTHTISCNFILNATSKGYDAGEVLNGFNDNFYGSGPDLGAQEDNTAAIQYDSSSPSAATTSSTSKSTSSAATSSAGSGAATSSAGSGAATSSATSKSTSSGSATTSNPGSAASSSGATASALTSTTQKSGANSAAMLGLSWVLGMLAMLFLY